MAGVLCEVQPGRTLRFPDGRTFEPGDEFTVWPGSELPDPQGAADIEMSQVVFDYEADGYISAGGPLPSVVGSASDLDQDPLIRELQAHKNLLAIANGCYSIDGHLDGVYPGAGVLKRCYGAVVDSLLVGGSVCAQLLAGAPTFHIEVAGVPVGPPVPFAAPGVPTAAAVVTPVPVPAGAKVEFVITLAPADSVTDVGVLAMLICKLAVKRTAPTLAIVEAEDVIGVGPVVIAPNTFNPIS
jgi:hypothetical protein